MKVATLFVSTVFAAMASTVNPDAVFFESGDGGFVGTNLGRWANYRPASIEFDSGLRVSFPSALSSAYIVGIDRQSATVNLLTGDGRSESRRTFASIRYSGLYPGVDMRCAFTRNGWKSDFLLKAGAQVASIRIRYQGIGDVTIGKSGQLRLMTPSGEMEERIPEAYQVLPGGRKAPVRANFRITSEGLVGFETSTLDPSLPTVIDPDLLYYSFWGGNRNEAVTAIGAGSDDSMYIAGWTESTNLPVYNAAQSSHRGSTDAFVAKLSPNGQSLIWATFLGGTGSDKVNGMAIDSSGRAVIAGVTSSSNFPLQTAVQSTLKGASDGFVARLSASGSSLEFSTYYGGAGADTVNAVAVDSTGIYLGGQTNSTDFPVANGVYSTARGAQDGFAAKLSTAGTSTVYSTYIGGSNDDSVNAIAVYQQQAIVAGGTSSANLSVVGGSGPRGGMDGFMVKLGSSGSSISASTYLGGSTGSSASPEMATAIQVTQYGEPVVAGITPSSDFPVTNAVQPAFARGGSDGFVAKYTPGMGAAQWSTYLGGNSYDIIYALAIRPSGQIVVVGMTASANFPSVQPLQPAFGGYYDGFVTILLANGGIGFSTLAGANGSDTVLAVATGITNPNALFFAGSTNSSNIILPGNPYQATSDPQSLNGYLAKLQIPGGTLHPIDKIGIFRNGGWALDKTGDSVWNAGDIAFSLGMPTDVPVVGDWTGTGQYRIGVFRAGTWYVDINGDNNWTWGVDAYFYYGIPGDIPVVGDWNGDGRSKAGVYRNGTWFLDWDGNNAWTNNVDKIIPFGTFLDKPVVGDWTGTGITKIGLYRDGLWSLDSNGDFVFTPGTDTSLTLGTSTDIPIPMYLSGTSSQPVVWRASNGAWIKATGTIAYYGYPGDRPVVGPW